MMYLRKKRLVIANVMKTSRDMVIGSNYCGTEPKSFFSSWWGEAVHTLKAHICIYNWCGHLPHHTPWPRNLEASFFEHICAICRGRNNSSSWRWTYITWFLRFSWIILSTHSTEGMSNGSKYQFCALITTALYVSMFFWFAFIWQC